VNNIKLNLDQIQLPNHPISNF